MDHLAGRMGSLRRQMDSTAKKMEYLSGGMEYLAGKREHSAAQMGYRALPEGSGLPGSALHLQGLRNGGVPASTPPRVTAQAAELGSGARSFEVFFSAVPAPRTGRR